MQNNKVLQILLGIFLVVLIVFVGVQTRNASESYNYIGKVQRDRDVISIEGEGKVTAKPDIATVDIGLQTEFPTVKEAQAGNTKKMNAILQSMKDLGVEEKDLQTTNYSIYPRTEWKDGTSRVIGYGVTQSVTVKIRNLDRAGDVLAKAGELGANQVGGIQFTIDDPAKLKEEARSKAIENARKKAQALADQLGLRIVKVVTFNEQSQGYVPQPYMMAKSMAMEAAAPVAPQIQPGSTDVISNVTVTFEVR